MSLVLNILVLNTLSNKTLSFSHTHTHTHTRKYTHTYTLCLFMYVCVCFPTHLLKYWRKSGQYKLHLVTKSFANLMSVHKIFFWNSMSPIMFEKWIKFDYSSFEIFLNYSPKIIQMVVFIFAMFNRNFRLTRRITY